MADALTSNDNPLSPPPAGPGVVTLARHGEPALSRKVRLSSADYRNWWGTYETKGLKAGQTPPDCLRETARRAGVIISSIRPRSIETAQAVCAGRVFAQDPLFVEAPLPPPALPEWIRLSPKIWGFLARLRWVFSDRHDEVETHRQAKVRADEAAKLITGLAEEGQDVLVVAHGYFNHMVGRSLKAQGWRCVQDQGFRYWCSRKYERAA